MDVREETYVPRSYASLATFVVRVNPPIWARKSGYPLFEYCFCLYHTINNNTAIRYDVTVGTAVPLYHGIG